jgi:hypothetical protein
MTHAPVPDVLRMLVVWVQDPEARACLLACADTVEKLREVIRRDPSVDQKFALDFARALACLDAFPVCQPAGHLGHEN